jgi:aminoglycoside phosphotransferase (APT) family kinase protein
LRNDREKIEWYLKGLSPGILGVESMESIKVLDMTPGAYNLNYHVRVNRRDFVFRINIEPQSGLSDQIEYEFGVLKFLEGHGVAPKAYYLDNSRERFEYGILIEEYLNGPHLSLEDEAGSDVAALLNRLHALAPGDNGWIVWDDPLGDTYGLARCDLIVYEGKKSADRKVITLSKKLLGKIEARLGDHRSLYTPDCLNHTDVACDNFIITSGGLRLIDWEKPRVDDPTYDVCCFLSEPAQRWCSPKVLSQEGRETFLKTYVQRSGKEEDLFRKKIGIRQPLVSLHWILWGAGKLCDLKARRTAPALLQAHEEKRGRYERIALPENIEKLLDSF